jgi:hypothetical protein
MAVKGTVIEAELVTIIPAISEASSVAGTGTI